MNLKQTIEGLQKIYDEYGDIPVVMYGQEGKRYSALVIEEIKPIVFPPECHKLEGVPDTMLRH